MVYIIEAINGTESTFKIGYTIKQKPRTRLLQLQKSNPLQLKMVGGIFGNKEDEEALHRLFRDYRIHGEWFTDCRGIRKLIKDFPISEYLRLEHGYKWGFISFEEFFLNATMLKLEDMETIRKVLKEKGAKWKSLAVN